MGMSLARPAAWLHGPGYAPYLLYEETYKQFGSFIYLFIFFRIAIYKVLYRLFGGYVSDVVAAIDQVLSSVCIPIIAEDY